MLSFLLAAYASFIPESLPAILNKVTHSRQKRAQYPHQFCEEAADCMVSLWNPRKYLSHPESGSTPLQKGIAGESEQKHLKPRIESEWSRKTKCRQALYRNQSLSYLPR